MIHERAQEIKVIKVDKLNGTKQDKPTQTATNKELQLLDGKSNKIDYRGTNK